MKKNEIALIQGTDYKQMTKDILAFCNLAGHLEEKRRQLGRDSLVIGIKPNLVSPTEASYGATTHPEVVAGLIEYLQEKGETRLQMMESSWVGDKTADALEVCGYNDLSEKYGVPFYDMQKEKGIPTDCGGMELSICRAYFDVDFLINVPVLKGHCQTRITCALKNMKGLIPNPEKRRFHKLGLHRPIAHLNTAIHQDFILVDHICGDLDFEDGGNPVVMNRILAGTDPVLMDAYVCAMMNYRKEDVPYIGLAEALGVGCGDITRADIVSVRDDANEKKSRNIEVDDLRLPKSGKVVELADAVEEVESCSACYGYLIPALDRLREEGLLAKLDTRICIGQGYRGCTGQLGVGTCTAGFAHSLKGCPPTEQEMYGFLKDYIRNR